MKTSYTGKYCKWVVRPGTNNTFWAFTTCNPGCNYLSRINDAESIRPAYENRLCPICDRPIKIDTELLEQTEIVYT